MVSIKQMDMRKSMLCLLGTLMIGAHSYGQQSAGAPNTLTAEEKDAGWELLFDGTIKGWRAMSQENFPEQGWTIKDGAIVTYETGEGVDPPGDIITQGQYGQFELKWEWKLITKGGNTGVKYFVDESLSRGGKSGLGLEYQLLDDKDHPWMLEGKMSPNDYHTLGALYEFFPPDGDQKQVYPLGEWNSSRIISKGKNVEHWLNGKRVLKYKRGGKPYLQKLKLSKFSRYKNFGMVEQGHILLQYHGSEVQFRNIKIRQL
jgi:hypothetical protein